MNVHWQGVLPAVTTPFDRRLEVDHAFLARHCAWLVDSGCAAIVPLGSLGESATLTHDEKVAVIETVVGAVGGRVAVVAGVAAASTVEAVRMARRSAEAGAAGLMVLPPYVYAGDEREMEAHVAAVISATPLPCMLYNNPVAYKTDFRPEQIAALAAAHPNLVAVKESTTDVRRITAIRALIGERLSVLVGVDDAIVEGVAAGAVGWIAGLANALPAESVALFRHAVEARYDAAFALYRWFLPLLRMDTVPKFVQLIKLVQEEAGMGSARVRPPRMALEGTELAAARALIRTALETRPPLDAVLAQQ